jgi:hypothetical protein
MNLPACNHSRSAPCGGKARGSAVIVVLVLIAIVLLFLGGTMRTLHWLGRDLRLIEKKQLQRLAPAAPPRQPAQPAPLSPGTTNHIETPER